MSERKQNLFVFMEPSEYAWRTPLKGGNMILNRFCIDEDAAFELSGVHYLKKSSKDLNLEYLEELSEEEDSEDDEFKLRDFLREEKGKEDSF